MTVWWRQLEWQRPILHAIGAALMLTLFAVAALICGACLAMFVGGLSGSN